MTNFQLIWYVIEQHPFVAALSVLLVFVPIAVWMYIFTRRERETKKAVATAFVVGIGSAVIMFFYQSFWERTLDFGFFELTPVNFQSNIGGWTQIPLFSIFLVAMSIGLIEEYLKHWVVKKANHSHFRCVNDVMQLSIVAALGFAFTENVIYLFREFLTAGVSERFFSLLILRSIFVVFVHVLCSGIYAYYYGVGFYARPILETNEQEGRKTWIPGILHRVIHWKKDRVFHDEMVAYGLIISMVVHGIFDFFMSVNWTVGDILGIEAMSGVGIHLVVLPTYLFLGLWYLWHLMDKKTDHEKFGRVEQRTVYVEYDFKKNLERMKKMESNISQHYKSKESERVAENFEKNLERMKNMEQRLNKHYRDKYEASNDETEKKSSESAPPSGPAEPMPTSWQIIPE